MEILNNAKERLSLLRREVTGKDADLSRQYLCHADISLLYLLTSDHFQYLTGRETTSDRKKQTDNRISWDTRSCALIQNEKEYCPISCWYVGRLFLFVSKSALLSSCDLAPDMQ
jgi:hypothetical protein